MNIDNVAIQCARELAVGADPDDLVIVDAGSAMAYLESEYGIDSDAWGVVSPSIAWVTPEGEYDPTSLPDDCPAFTGVHIVGKTLYIVGNDGMCSGYWYFTRKE